MELNWLWTSRSLGQRTIVVYQCSLLLFIPTTLYPSHFKRKGRLRCSKSSDDFFQQCQHRNGGARPKNLFAFLQHHPPLVSYKRKPYIYLCTSVHNDILVSISLILAFFFFSTHCSFCTLYNWHCWLEHVKFSFQTITFYFRIYFQIQQTSQKSSSLSPWTDNDKSAAELAAYLPPLPQM